MNTILKTYKNGKQTNFERFKVKTAKAILNQYKKAFAPYQFDNFFFRDYREADAIRIYATPDHYNTGELLAEYTPQEFFAAIS